MAHDPKYTVQTRLTTAENRLAQLEAALPRLKHELLTELTKYADANFHGRDGVDGLPGRDGNDCQCRSIPGPQGENGDITIVGDAELAAAVAQLRAEKARAQAAFLIAIDENSKRPHSGLKRVLAATLETLKRDAGL